MIVYIAGSPWDGVAGTDRHLASALAVHEPVLWVDPPASVLRQPRLIRGGRSARTEVGAPGIVRLRVVGPPGVTRPVIRDIAGALVAQAIRAAIRRAPGRPTLVVVAGPEAGFPRRIPGRRLLFLTDDWVAGADLMGLSRRRIARRLRANGQAADVVAAVTPDLAEAAGRLIGRSDITVLPNGTHLSTASLDCRTQERRPIAGLVGQLNERLDLDVLEAVLGAGVEILVVGPRRDRDPEFARRMDAFLAHPRVRWVGERAADELPELLASISVGLTPYADTPFNRASFPLKTLEYLAAGCAVVASDLPATRWLNTDLVEIAADPEDFARRVTKIMDRPGTADDRTLRREFARTHSWEARARELLDLASPELQSSSATVHSAPLEGLRQ